MEYQFWFGDLEVIPRLMKRLSFNVGISTDRINLSESGTQPCNMHLILDTSTSIGILEVLNKPHLRMCLTNGNHIIVPLDDVRIDVRCIGLVDFTKLICIVDT